MRRFAWAGLLGLLGAASIVASAPVVSVDELLLELGDRDSVARWPSPAYTCKQFSSYDRRAESPDKQESWYANGDASQFIRRENRDGRREAVLMDIDGPGAVVRFWATWQHDPRNTLRIYLDGADKPTLEGPMCDLIDGGLIVGPPLGEGVSPLTPYNRRGHNLYFPIPYAKHCKITYEEPIKGPLYYQINYRTYAAGTTVKTFRPDDPTRLKTVIARLQRALALPVEPATDGDTAELAGTIEPGKSRGVELKGPRAIRRLVLNVKAANEAQALRSTVLEMSFDGERTVWCPIGYFFGTGTRLTPYRSWYTRITPDGAMTCYWSMPFAERATVALHNLSTQAVDVVLGDVSTGPWVWDERSMHFHATWHELTRVATQTNTGADHGAFDVNYVTAAGQGVYVGDTLTVDNGAAGWWGEGDEKIYVDGEAFPSHFGTGTEDYYGYAWCVGNFFESPFHAQPFGDGNNAVNSSVNSRYRSLDAIPFTKALRFDMELWHWKRTIMNYAPATFWYARPGATCSVSPDPAAAALPAVPLEAVESPAPEAPRVAGALEGEALNVAEITGGEVKEQAWHAPIWSAGKQRWWTGAKPGDRLVLEVPVAKAGRYTVTANLTLAKDYAVVAVSLGGKVLTESLDLYNPEVIARKVELGTVALSEGTAKLEVRIVGANEQAEKAYMVGLDYLKLDAAKE